MANQHHSEMLISLHLSSSPNMMKIYPFLQLPQVQLIITCLIKEVMLQAG
jgi:hypothetical protein